LEDVYEALSKILMLDKQIADYGIISLDTSIFQKKKKESGIISSGF
jgi:hypothetical protein